MRPSDSSGWGEPSTGFRPGALTQWSPDEHSKRTRKLWKANVSPAATPSEEMAHPFKPTLPTSGTAACPGRRRSAATVAT